MHRSTHAIALALLAGGMLDQDSNPFGPTDYQKRSRGHHGNTKYTRWDDPTVKRERKLQRQARRHSH